MSPRQVPLWDLFHALQALMKHPFEPISSVSIHFFNLEDVFVVVSHALGRSDVLYIV